MNEIMKILSNGQYLTNQSVIILTVNHERKTQ